MILERGIITQISGPVVDVRIESGELPRLREELTVEKDGAHRVMEVAQHLNSTTVRCIMLSPSEGLARGLAVDVPGHTIQVPGHPGADVQRTGPAHRRRRAGARGHPGAVHLPHPPRL